MENIRSKSEYYFITRDKINTNCISLPNLKEFKVVDDSLLSIFQHNKPSLVIPRAFLKNLCPAKDFLIRVSIKNNGISVYTTDTWSAIGDLITEQVYRDVDTLTHVLMSAGLPSVDMGEALLVVSPGTLLTKFTDSKVKEKLCHTILYSLIGYFDLHNFGTQSEFKLNNSCGLEVCCAISPSSELEKRMGKEVGIFQP